MNRLLRRTLFTGSAALAGAVLWGAQSASADDGADQAQEAVVDNSTTQYASAVVDSGQSNVSAPVTVGGMSHDHEWKAATPTSGGGGGGGDVTQSNDATNAAIAANHNSTDQFVAQGQGASNIAVGGHATGGGQTQDATVDNSTRQYASADVDNDQSNVSKPVSVGGGGGGDVTQSNDATNAAIAANHNSTDQFVAQGQGASNIAVGGHASGGGQTQDATVDNSTRQYASADVDNDQSNVSKPVSVGGRGGGDITQSNSAHNSAIAANSNDTVQEVLQGQGANSAAAHGAKDAGHDGKGAGQSQSADVTNETKQSAAATVDNGQVNVSAPVSVGGGGGGDVTQSNSAHNSAIAGNANNTEQFVEQGQAGSGAGGGQDQSATIDNATHQSANAAVHNGQYNIYAPVSVFSPGAGSGSVTQSNTATNQAAAGNFNTTEQAALQEQAGSGAGGGQDQSADLSNTTGQRAGAAVYNGQINIYAPVSVFSPGAGSGSVTQSNSATNKALAVNANDTFQGVVQGQAASGSGGKSSGQQQDASLFNATHQSAKANVYNVQANIHAPVTVGGSGAGGGAVHQSNAASNSASAFNLNRSFQLLFQAAGIHVFRF